MTNISHVLGQRRTAARPGPGAVPAEILRSLDLGLRRRIDGLLAGEHRSTTLGPGTEFAQLRPYQLGDDVRLIDWNATARTGEPHVRVQVAERHVVTWLVLDTSPSMVFGTADRRKADVAEGVALAIGHLSTRHGNRLGIVTFGDQHPRVLPPRQGHVGLLGLIDVLSKEPDLAAAGQTELGEALRRTGRLARQRAMITIVSDFRGPRDWRTPLVGLAGRHEVLAIEIQDQREQELPDVGELYLVDPETGRQVRVDTSRRRLRERFATVAANERRQVAEELTATGAEHLVLSTSGDWLRALANFLRLRRHR